MTTVATRRTPIGDPVHDELLDVDQAAAYLGMKERFVRRLIAERRIEYVKLGKFVRLQRSTLDAFIDAGRVVHT